MNIIPHIHGVGNFDLRVIFVQYFGQYFKDIMWSVSFLAYDDPACAPCHRYTFVDTIA